MNQIINNEINILVVDDDLLMRSTVSAVLAKIGFNKIDTAENGNVALGKLISSEPPYDLIICDLNMPEMDGVEFMRHAKEADFCGGIILLSGEDKRMLEIAKELATTQQLNILGMISKPPTRLALEDLLTDFQPAVSEKKHAFPQQAISQEELEQGLSETGKELLLHYQPIVHIRSGEITGVETLARWRHPERGVLGPNAFIPLAEQSGLMNTLTRRIFRTAALQTVRWLREKCYLTTSINFSLNSFTDLKFAEQLISITDEIPLDPKYLLLELTENQVMDDAASCMESLMRMRFKKFGLAIDDFGTRKSSLEQLKRIPFTQFKIAQSIVQNAADNEGARQILESCISLAKRLEMEIIAKGVETRADWELMETLGCDYAQGTYCSEPLTSDKIPDFVENWRPPSRER